MERSLTRRYPFLSHTWAMVKSIPELMCFLAIAGLLSLATASASVAQTPIATSTFDTDNEGWTVVGDAQGGTGKPDYFPTGGNPGGYISATDDGRGGYWYWLTPAKFLGDISAAYGQTLTFDLKQTSTANQADRDDVILSGQNLTLVFDTSINPGTEWTSYAVPLDEFAGWKNQATGVPATQEEMQSVLASLADLQIRGEYRVGADTGGLDNVVLGAGPSQQHGLLGEYFDGYFNDDVGFFDREAPVLTRVDATVNFPDTPWNLQGTPIADLNQFSVRWTGFIDIPVTGEYTFYTFSDDASYLFFDEAASSPTRDNATVNNGGAHPPTERSGVIHFEQGLHPVLVLFGEAEFGEVIRLSWESADAGIAKQVVPSSVLHVSGVDVPPNDGGACTVGAITFTWFPVTGANAYRLDIATEPTETGIIDVIEVGNALSYTYDQNLIEGVHYYARVAASTDSGATYNAPSPFSDGIVIDRRPPTVNTPDGRLLDEQRVQFVFSGFDDQSVANYHIQIDTVLAFETPVQQETISADGIFSFTGAPGQTYYARAFAIDCAGNQSPYSEASNGVSVAPLPDLLVAEVALPPEAFSGQPFSVSWVVSNAGASNTTAPEWFDRVYLSTSSTFDPDIATVLGFAKNVSYLNPGEGYSKTAELTLPQGIAGPYYVYVFTDVDDAQAESDGQNNIGRSAATVQVNLTLPPDLQVVSLMAPDNAFSGQSVEVAWTVQNAGNGTTEADNWLDTIYLSPDSVLQVETDTNLGAFDHRGVLSPDSTYSRSETVTLPQAIFGSHYLLVVTDATNAVYEHAWEGNNTRSKSIAVTLTPPPDLVVTKLTVPDSAQSGQEMAVAWSVQNQGPGAPFEAGWSDRIYLATGPDFDPDSSYVLSTFQRSGLLEADSSYSAQHNVRLPNGIAGPFYVFMATDWNNRVFEYEFKDNNLRRSDATVDVALSPWPDLQVTQVQAPAQATAGEVISVTWSVENRGEARTVTASWLDRIYLAAEPNWNPANATRLLDVTQAQPLDTSASYTANGLITLPPDISGTYYLYVHTDANNSVFENADERNNVTRSDSLTVLPYPFVDLAVTQLVTPAAGFSGEPLTVRFTVENIGEGRTLAGNWHDAVYLSADSVLIESEDTLLQRLRRDGSLDPGEGYSHELSVPLPNGISGDYFLFAVADVDNRVAESNANNNARRSDSLSVELTASPDLVVASLETPATGQAAQPLNVRWTIENAGPGAIGDATWHDAIFLSTDSRLDRTDQRLARVTKRGPLEPEIAYSESLAVEIPPFAAGAYYLILKTDNGDDLYERAAEHNNTAANLVTLTLPPPADLLVTYVVVPDSALPGEEVTISWTVRNQGLNPAVGWLWDAVYVSADDKWQVADPLLGTERRFIDLAPGDSQRVSFKINLARTFRADAQGNITGELPGVTPGAYHAIVRTDIRNNIRESDDSNNALASAATFAVTVPALQLGVPTHAVLAEGQMKYYRVRVGPKLNLRVSLRSDIGAAANELYVAYDRVPSATDFDYSHSDPLVSDQQVLVPSTREGTYYILVQVRKLPQGSATETITITVEALPFSLFSVTPDRGGQRGRVTGTLTGAGFEDSTEVFLRDAQGQVVAAEILELVNSTELRIRWDLREAPLGLYDVVVRKSDGSEAELPQAFRVEPLVSGEIFTDVQGPEVLPGGRDAAYEIFVTNTNNVDADYIFLAIGVPANQKFTIRTTDFFGRPIPEAFLKARENPSAARRVGDVVFIIACAKNVPAGKTLRATMILHDIRGPAHAFMPFFVKAYALSRVDFFWREMISLYLLRQNILAADPDSVPPEVQELLRPEETARVYTQSLRQSGLLGDGPVTMPTLPLAYDPATQPAIDIPDFVNCDTFADGLAVYADVVMFAADVADLAFDVAFVAAAPPVGLMLLAADLGFMLYDAYKLSCNFKECSDWVYDETINTMIDAADLLLDLATADVTDLLMLGGEYVLVNGPALLCKELLFAYDPNDMIGPAGSGAQRWVARQRKLAYTINFENDPVLATAHAQIVRITHQLNSTLDARTFRLGRFGFGSFTFEPPENRSFYSQRLDVRDSLGVFVDFDAGIDITANQAFWIFKSVEPATGQQPSNPLVGFLPVNDALGRGQGFVTFTVKPKQTAETGEVVHARASIVFDHNEPIETPAIFNTLDGGAPVSRVNPLPDRVDSTEFVVSWSGQDDPQGAGIRSFALYVAADEGAFQLWRSGIEDTSVTFTGELGRRYGFFTIATDHARNVEAMKSSAEAGVIVSVPDANAPVPTRFVLHQNYPNPFNPTTTIKYDLPKTADVRLVIYNILGQRVKTLIDQRQLAGFHSVEWNGENDSGLQAATGLYLYVLHTPEFTRTKKMIWIK